MGATLEVFVDDHEATELFANLLARLGNLRPFMEEAGQIVTDDVKDNFQGHHDPEGTPWKPVSEAWAERKRLLRKDPANILILHGDLMSSIHWTAYGDRVVVGTNEPKAATHQFGARRGEFGWIQIRRKLRGAARYKKWGDMARFSSRYNTARIALPWGDIPARPFLGVSEAGRRELLAAGADYLETGK